MNNQETIETLAGKYLGRSISGSDHYNPTLLNPIPRKENRDKYNIEASDMPFCGVDIWHCYELSFLNKNGMPISVIAKISYPSDSEFIIESKSLKLYLNSFNMQKIDTEWIDDAKDIVKATIIEDLSKVLGTIVTIQFHTDFHHRAVVYNDFFDLGSSFWVDLSEISCDKYIESPELLNESSEDDKITGYAFKWNGLKSNCRVTHQPDFGDIYIKFGFANNPISIENIIKYLVSFREENHFQEEVVEIIYKRLLDFLDPVDLVVGAIYARRGGINICPIRASRPDILDENWIDVNTLAQISVR